MFSQLLRKERLRNSVQVQIVQIRLQRKVSVGPQSLHKYGARYQRCRWCEVTEKTVSIFHTEHWKTVEDNLIISNVSQAPT